MAPALPPNRRRVALSITGIHTGLSGFSVNERALEVASNNLANVTTTGFKASQAHITDGSGGRGANLAATTRNRAQGPLRLTGQPFDLAVDGQGFFVATRPDGSFGYTRDGTFLLDGLGRLVTSEGNLVDPSITVPSDATGLQVGTNGTVSAQVGGDLVDVGTLDLATFANPEGLRAVGGNVLVETAASGAAARFAPGFGAPGRVVSGALEVSNTDIAAEMVAMIVEQRGTEANASSIRSHDSMVGTVIDVKR
jgi:flagellar basal-body rod protein FlgG